MRSTSLSWMLPLSGSMNVSKSAVLGVANTGHETPP